MLCVGQEKQFKHKLLETKMEAEAEQEKEMQEKLQSKREQDKRLALEVHGRACEL